MITNNTVIDENLEDLQKLILNSEGNVFNSFEVVNKEVKTLDPTKIKNILNLETTPELILLIIAGLKKNILNKNLILIQSINSLKKEEDLVLVGLALRFGANPNQYVNSGLGIIHLIGYTYAKLYNKIEENVFKTLISILLNKGSDLKHDVFKMEKNSKYIKNENTSDQNLKDWIKLQKYKLYQDSNYNYSNVLIYLDNDSMLSDYGKIENLDLDLIIKTHSNKIFDIYVRKIDLHDLCNSSIIRKSIMYYNFYTFQRMINFRILPDYFEKEEIVNNIKFLDSNRFYLSSGQLQQFLTISENDVNILSEFLDKEEILLSDIIKQINIVSDKFNLPNDYENIMLYRTYLLNDMKLNCIPYRQLDKKEDKLSFTYNLDNDKNNAMKISFGEYYFSQDLFSKLLEKGDNIITNEKLDNDIILELKNKNRMLDALGIRNIKLNRKIIKKEENILKNYCKLYNKNIVEILNKEPQEIYMILKRLGVNLKSENIEDKILKKIFIKRVNLLFYEESEKITKIL